MPPGYTKLSGPRRCGDDLACGVTDVRNVNAGGVRRIGVVQRGLDTTLAIETSSGWFFESVAEPGPRQWSHHRPLHRGYDLTATRVDDGALVVRLVDSRSMFYPGQGPVGSSSTTWFDRRCVVVDSLVHCGAPMKIASEACTTELVQAPGPTREPTYAKKCSGGPPST